MKKIFAKPYNLLFAAAVVIFLQFLSSVIALYIKTLEISSLAEWSFYIYMIYCAVFCVIAALTALKKRGNDNKNINYITGVKIWFSGIFLYIFFEMLFFARLIYSAYADINGFSLWGENSEISDSVYNLWDNQPMQKLYICCALIFVIYCALFILERKKIYAALAGINLIINGLFIVLFPFSFISNGIEDGENIIEIFAVTVVKEAGTLILLINLLICAFYMLYKQEE